MRPFQQRRSSCCFNLVIESLIFSSAERHPHGHIAVARFNLVIESLIFSSLRRFLVGHNERTAGRFNLVIESLIFSRSRKIGVLPALSPRFNLVIESLIFSSEVSTSWQLTRSRFNLVIESLIFSRLQRLPATPHQDSLFQSRNRESYLFKTTGGIPELIITLWFQSRNRESYLFKWARAIHKGTVQGSRFNLVIESLIFSRIK